MEPQGEARATLTFVIGVPASRRPQGTHGGAAEINEEYVVFDGSQALPLCLVFYEAYA